MVPEREMRSRTWEFPGYLPHPSTSADRFAQGHIPFQTLLLPFLDVCGSFSRRTSRFYDTGSLRSPPENSRFDDMNIEEKTLRHRQEVDHHDRWTNTCTIVVPGGDGHDYSPPLGTIDAGTTLETDGLSAGTGTKAGSVQLSPGVGFYRTSESPRGLGGFSEMELQPVGFPAADDAGNQPCEPETGRRKGGIWGERGRWARPSTNTADMIPITSEDSGSNSVLRSAGPFRSDQVEGVWFSNNLVPKVY